MKKISIIDATAMTGIYLIEYPNGKKYVGQAQNIHARILEHNSRARVNHRGDGKEIQICDKAIQKYYPDGIKEYIVLEECSIDQLDEKEKYWINYYNSYNTGYNLLDQGDVSGRRGIDNVNASLSKEQLDEVVDLLLNHYEYSYNEIAEKVGTTLNVVQRVCWGKAYVNNNLNYPLRQNVHAFSEKNNVENYFNDTQHLLELKEDLKYSWWLRIETDLVEKYSIPLNIMHDINTGKKFGEIGDYTYPIRNKNVRNTHNMTKESIEEILNLLKNSSESMVSIGKKYNFGRAAIGKINKGETYPIKGYNYPARKTN